MHQKCFDYALTNLLFGLFRSMWIIDSFITHSSPHPKAIARPSTPEMLWTKERIPTFFFFVIFTFKFAFESYKEFVGVP
jgi:hypothetical protein